MTLEKPLFNHHLWRYKPTNKGNRAADGICPHEIDERILLFTANQTSILSHRTLRAAAALLTAGNVRFESLGFFSGTKKSSQILVSSPDSAPQMSNILGKRWKKHWFDEPTKGLHFYKACHS